MSTNLPTCGHLLALAFGAMICLGAQPGSTAAQTRGLSLDEELGRADELYRADKPLQAEALYRRALVVAAGDDLRHCFERLLSIYGRVGRLDQAVQTALKYRDWLNHPGDAARLRELDLDLGRWYFALGHYADAERHLERALADLKGGPLSPAREVTALTFRALAAEKKGDRVRADRAWRQVEAFAVERLEDPRRELDLPLRIECARRLADSYRFQARPEKAVPRLERALEDFDRLKEPDPAGLRDTLRQLAGHLAAPGVDRVADAEAPCVRPWNCTGGTRRATDSPAPTCPANWPTRWRGRAGPRMRRPCGTGHPRITGRCWTTRSRVGPRRRGRWTPSGNCRCCTSGLASTTRRCA
jgi:hypothetical protein